ncbi:pheromone autoinducer 2 transporter [Rubripirellula lacrimiformis]|uniref:Pheromone autoinducer 2 transporter n=1 Tax=Rubripirellula lacrimiformis TaxID=1930273 RepID=A0A517N521_9BACT|nr:AI-2E family transporter [Rubripirellula lacrimiformis]QDT02234.1 pheromone autoinducer 2 transporter [Rubripirellula lacrimiformis]
MNRQPDDRTTESKPSKAAGVVSTRICAAMLVLYALYFARSLVIPTMTALVLYLTLRPIVRRARRFGIPPVASATGIIAGITLLLGLSTYLVFDPAQQTIANAPEHLSVVKQKLSFVTERLKDVDEATEELAEAEDSASNDPQEDEPVPVEIKQPSWTSGWTYLSGTGNLVSFVTVCIALLYFLLATGDDLLRSIMHALPDFTARRKLIEVIQNVQEGLGTYLAKISTINACLGVSVGIAMWLLGMPSPVLWGVMAFTFNFIPILGAITGAVIIFVVALVSFDPTYYAFVVAATFLTLTSLEGQFITPVVLGRSMSISPILVFLSIVLWGWMWGIMGVFLSVPILIAARMACEGYDGLQPMAMILGAEVPEATTEASEQTREAESETANAKMIDSAHVSVGRPHSPRTSATPAN